VITVRGEIVAGAILSPNALKITEAVWLQIEVGWHPSDEEIRFLKQGLTLVARDVERTSQEKRPILVRLIDLQYNPTDYQPEGLAAAIAEWAAQACGFPKLEIPVVFNSERRRYVFDFPFGRTRIDITAPPNTWVGELVLRFLQHSCPDAVFQALGSIEKKPLRKLDKIAVNDFWIIPHHGSPRATERAVPTTSANQGLRFQLNETSSYAPGPQGVTVFYHEWTEEVERLQRSLEKTLRANELSQAA
jgi:hypothetical protein